MPPIHSAAITAAEVRPIFIFQHTPSNNWIYAGGDIEVLALQARVALTERWSLVLNKLGWIWQDPKDGALYPWKDGAAIQRTIGANGRELLCAREDRDRARPGIHQPGEPHSCIEVFAAFTCHLRRRVAL